MPDTFFESEVVMASLQDIMDLQMEVLLFAEYGMYASTEDQRENLKVLRTLLAKQKNMFFRCMLSDSPAAKELMAEILEHFKEHGHENAADPLKVFESMSDQIDKIEEDINKYEQYE